MEIEEQTSMTLKSYLRDYLTGDPRCAATFYDVPYTLIEPAGPVVFSSLEAIEKRFSTLMKHTRAAGFEGAEWLRLEPRALSGNIAIAEAELAWLNAEGREAERLALTYVLRNNGEAWKISVVIPHGPPRRA
jgi:hypothetical protein